MKKILILLSVGFLYAPISVFADVDDLRVLLDKKTGFTAAEKKELLDLYVSSEKEQLYPDMLYQRIAEGIAKKVSFERMRHVVRQTADEVRSIHGFCTETRKTSFPLVCSERTVKNIMYACNNGFSIEHIRRLHEKAGGDKRDPDAFAESMKDISILHKRGYGRKNLEDLFLFMYNQRKDDRYIKKTTAFMMRVRDERIAGSIDIIENGIRENRALYDIEQEVTAQRSYRGDVDMQEQRRLEGEEEERIRSSQSEERMRQQGRE